LALAIIRRAVPDDKEAILGFCANTFDWGDYVEEVIDDWIADRSGRLLVASEGGTAVAMAHLAARGPGEGWLEGMRVNPSLRRTGLGASLTSAAIDEALTMGLHVLRMAINQTNIPSQSLARKLGFRPLLTFSSLCADQLPAKYIGGVRVAVPEDKASLMKMLKWSSCGGLSFFDWEARTIDEEFVDDGIRTGRFWVFDDGGGIVSCLSFKHEQSYGISIGDLAGAQNGLRALLEFVRCKAGEMSEKEVALLCVTGGPEEDMALYAGFTDQYDGGDESGREIIFEKHI
jgi:GNAT superfamily N-acetyltransferase